MAKKEATKTKKLAVNQGETNYTVGPGNPPKEYQFKPGQSGNPKGQPKHRTHLWTYYCQYMGMTDAELAKVDSANLTQAQQTALKLVQKAKSGKGCGAERMARYIVDREEGRAVEHLVIGTEEDLSDAECEQIRHAMLSKYADLN